MKMSQEFERTSNALGPTIDSSSQPASLPRQVEPKIETQKLLECLPCHSSNSPLTDVGKGGIEKFAEYCRAYPRRTI